MNKVYLSLIILVFNVILNELHAQLENLILNGNFEELELREFSASINGVEVSTPKDTSFLWRTNKVKNHYPVYSKFWYSNSFSNTYYSKTGNSNSGFVYGKIIPFKRNDSNSFWIANIGGKFCKPLKKGVKYNLSFYLKFFDGNTSSNFIEVKFSDKEYRKTGYVKVDFKKKKIIPKSHLADILEPDFRFEGELKDTNSYQKIETTYIAKGGEKYIYIGNLSYETPERLVVLKKEKGIKKRYQTPYCSYLIDDVILTSEVDDCGEVIYPDSLIDVSKFIVPKASSISFEKVDTIMIENAYFDSGQSLLSETDKAKILKKIGQIDFQNVKRVDVFGHTDNIGSEKANIELSLKRAEAVKQLIEPYFDQVFARGLGRSKPLNENSTPEERSVNRRVEVLVYWK